MAFVSFGIAVFLVNSALGADEPGKGEVRLPSGLNAKYEYHFDRNALRDSVRIGRELVVLTASSNLMLFDLKTQALVREWYGTRPITAIGRGRAGDLLVGFEDGDICQFDVSKFTVKALGKVAGTPRWIVSSPSPPALGNNVLAVFEPAENLVEGGVERTATVSWVSDFGSDRTYKLTERVTSAFLDRKRTLWLAGDRGEWGGWCSYVDLDRGSVRTVNAAPKREGPEGPPSLAGGLTVSWRRQPARSGYLVECRTWDRTRRLRVPRRSPQRGTEELYRHDNREQRKAAFAGEKIPPTDRPSLPITHVLEGPGDDLTVVSYSDEIYRVDRSFQEMDEDPASSKVRFGWGRPDAVGSYPSIRRVWRRWRHRGRS